MRELCVEWFCTWSWYPEEKDECGEESIREKGVRTTPWKPAALLNAGSGKVSLESTDDWDLVFIFFHSLPISSGILPWNSWAGLCDWSQCPAVRRAFSLMLHPLMWSQQNSPQVLDLHPLSCPFVR